nr:hypothetical protein [Candidatus Sigynarchaeota archaeon]
MDEKIQENQESFSDRKAKAMRFMNPGFGLFIMGLVYIIWWVMPIPIEYFDADPRWAHNWAYAIIITTAGASWYQKTPVSRIIASVQAFMLPVTASGSVNTILMTIITIAIAIGWVVVVGIERSHKKPLLGEKLSKRATLWLTLHSQVVTWLLIAHMGFVFLLSRAPFENQLQSIGTYIAFLANLPPEYKEIATW